MRRIASSCALAALAALTLAACGSDAETPQATAEGEPELSLVSSGELTVCTNPPYAPFEEVVDGEIVGFDIDLVREIAGDLGLETTAISTGFDAIESGAALNLGQCDIVASAITITDARSQNMDFTAPYFDADQSVLVGAGTSVTSESDLEGLRIGVQQATTGATWVTDQGLTGVEFEDLGLQVQALRNGQVDAIVNDVAVTAAYADAELSLALTIPTGEQYGFGIAKDNSALLEAADATLERIQSDGTYDDLYAEHIGAAPSGD